MRLTTLCLLLCWTAPALAADPTDHAPLLRALAEETTRQRAIDRLRTMGLPAVRAALDASARGDAALEQGLRAFLGSLDWSRPRLRAIVDRALGQLTGNLGQGEAFFASKARSRAQRERGWAMRALLRMGPAVRERLADALAGGTQLAGQLEVPTSAQQGQSLTATVRVRNAGARHLWLPVHGPSIQCTARPWQRPLLLVVGTQEGALGSGGGGRWINRCGRGFLRRDATYDPLRGYAALAPGASLVRARRTVRAMALGELELRWSSTARGPLIRCPSGQLTGLALGRPQPLTLTQRVHVTPLLRERPQPQGGLQLEARASEGVRGVRLTLRNVGPQPVLAAAPAQPEAPLWWVAIDASGVPRRWRHVGASATQLPLARLATLAPGAALGHRLDLAGLAPGRYRVVVGYGGVSATMLAAGDSTPWTGALESNVVQVRVR